MTIVAMLLGSFFLVSGVSKIRRIGPFTEALARYDLRASNLTATAWVWVAIETTAGLWALVSPVNPMLLLSGALGLATGAVARRVQQGAEHDCGCSSKTHMITSRLVWKNLAAAVLVLAVAYALGGPDDTSWAAGAFLLGLAFGAISVGHRASTATPQEA